MASRPSTSHAIEKNLVEADGKKYAVYVGKKVSLAHQVQITGPRTWVTTFVGMQSWCSRRTSDRLREPGCIMGGRSRRALRTRRDRAQEAEDATPVTDDYLRGLNKEVVREHLAG